MGKAFVQNSADEEQVKKGKHKEQLRVDRELDDVKTLMASDVFRRFMWRVLGACGMNRSSVATDPHETYFNEGHRSVGLFLEKALKEANFEAFIAMQLEAKKEEELNAE